MRLRTSSKFKRYHDLIDQTLRNFKDNGTPLFIGGRNQLKSFEVEGLKLNVKSFKVPNLINKFAYRFIRKSKAQRSYIYAQHLLSNDIGTPEPIAYSEEISSFFFLKSYYVSEQLEYDLTFRDLRIDKDGHEPILRAFTRFTYNLHEKQIEFLDHSPGNTLIQLNNENYRFFLVDLNRMNFKKMDFDSRMRNFSRLTPKEEMVRIMASEYSKLIKIPEEEVFNKMWFYTQDFQKKFHQKRKMKKKLKFWKK